MKTVRIKKASLPLRVAMVIMTMTGVAQAGEETISAESGAAKPLDRSFTIAGDGTIDITNIRGNVIVTGSDQATVKLGGSLSAGSKLRIDSDAHHLELRVESEGGGGWFSGNGPQGDTALTLNVPHGVSVKLDMVSASGKIDGIDGKRVEVNSISGSVQVSADAHNVDVDCVSGDVTLKSRRPGATEHAHLQTVSGNIDVTDTDGRVKLETVSGKITFSSKSVAEFGAESVSGTVTATTAPAKGARLHLETMSGSLHLIVPASVSGRIHAETFSGALKSDFGTVVKAEYGPGSTLDAHVGEGDGRIEAQSFSGNIDLKKQ